MLTNKKYIAKKISACLLEKSLVACVNIISPIQSQYKYHGILREDTEYILNIKTRRDHYIKIQKVIEELHNYETPEIISLEILDGNEKYMKWIENEII